MNIFCLAFPLVVFLIGVKYTTHSLKNTDVYQNQKELVERLKETNKKSYQKWRKEILPIKYKIGYFVMVGMLICCAIVYSNVYYTDQTLVKVITVVFFVVFLDQSTNYYNRKINEYMLKQESGIYKKIAQNGLEIIEYMKLPMRITFILMGVCFLGITM